MGEEVGRREGRCIIIMNRDIFLQEQVQQDIIDYI